MLELQPDIQYPTYSIKVKTPVATLFVHIIEDMEGTPFRIMINASKTGTEVAASANALALLSTEILQKEHGFTTLLEHLSNITTDKAMIDYATGIKNRSIPEGLCSALHKYRNIKHEELRSKIGSKYRPPKLRQ